MAFSALPTWIRWAITGIVLAAAIPLLSLPSRFGFIPYAYPQDYFAFGLLIQYVYGLLIVFKLIPFDLDIPEPIGLWKIPVGFAFAALSASAVYSFKHAFDMWSNDRDAKARKLANRRPNRTD